MTDGKKSSGITRTCHLLNIKQPDRVSKRLKLSFQRIYATINVLKSNRAVNASMGLIDISDTGAGFFTHELLQKGATVEVCVTEPRILKAKGIVAWSMPVKSGVNSTNFPFRSGIQFVFENEMQRTAVQDFIQKINMDPLESLRASATASVVPAAGTEPAASPSPAAVPEGGAAAEAAPVAPASSPAAPTTPPELAVNEAAPPAEAIAEAPKPEAPAAAESPAAAASEGNEGDGQAKAA